MKKYLFEFWIYILIKIKIIVDKKIDVSDEVYVVYFNQFNKEVFICKSGSEALQLVKIIKGYHEATNKNYIDIFYGKASYVFQFKHLRVLDCKFIWNATEAEKQKIFSNMADIPIRKEETIKV